MIRLKYFIRFFTITVNGAGLCVRAGWRAQPCQSETNARAGYKTSKLHVTPPNAKARVCALHEQCTHHRRSVKMSNLQILLKIPIVRG